MKIRCMNCMKEYEDEYEICPNCGYIRGTKPKESYHLRPETILHDKYEIGTVIGFGGFGVIYKAWDKNLKKIVAIKEYYPTAFLNRIPGENSVRIYDKKNLEAFEKGKKNSWKRPEIWRNLIVIRISFMCLIFLKKTVQHIL